MDKLMKYVLIFIGIITVLVIGGSLILRFVILDYYNNTNELMNSGQYIEAIERFERLGDYKDSKDRIVLSQKYISYYDAITLYNSGKYEDAVEAFSALGDFEDSAEWIKESKYTKAKLLFENGEYTEADAQFSSLGNYKDSADLALAARYNHACALFNDGELDLAAQLFLELGDYRDSALYAAKALAPSINEKRQLIYDNAVELYTNQYYSEALHEFESISDFSDSEDWIEKCKTAIKRRENANTISGGIRYSAAVKKDGTVVTTGYNENGQSEVSEWKDIVSISCKGIVTIGLTRDGKAVVATNASNIDVSSWDNLVSVSAGERYVVGLKDDGTLCGDGHDMGDGQLAFADWTDIKAIATGWRHTVGLDNAGNVHITGYGSWWQERQIQQNQEMWSGIVAIAAGGGSGRAPGAGHTVGLREDGTVVAVGDNEYGQCDVDDWKDIIAIAAGDWFTVGLKSNGTVITTQPDLEEFPDLYAGACNVDGEGWNDIIAIAAGSGSTIGLKKDGSIVSVGYNDFDQSRNANEWEDIMVYDEWRQMSLLSD